MAFTYNRHILFYNNGTNRFLITNIPNTFTCVFEILVSKCKIICRFKISAIAGLDFK